MNDTYLVIGLGVTGQSVLRFLTRQGHQAIAFDTRETLPALNDLEDTFKDIPFQLSTLPEEVWQTVTQVVLSPGLPLDNPVVLEAQKRSLPVYGDVELFARHNQKPVAAITGTNGKSTVTTMVGEIYKAHGMKVQVCGNIGKPVLDALAEEADIFAIELSSFQLELTDSLKGHVACILNLAPDHLDRHGTFDNYRAAKFRIYMNAEHVVLNADDTGTHSDTITSTVTQFALAGADFSLLQANGKTHLAYQGKPFLAANELKVQGSHNHVNALAASAIAYAHGVPLATIAKGLCAFQGLPHRCQWVKESDSVTWFNDSKGTNVGATIAALHGLGQDVPGKIIWIAGGQGKGAEFNELKHYVQQYVKKSVLFGEDKADIACALDDNSEIALVNDLDEAIATAKAASSPGDYVLFSPACASFDMFTNFVHRGEVFIEKVKEL